MSKFSTLLIPMPTTPAAELQAALATVQPAAEREYLDAATPLLLPVVQEYMRGMDVGFSVTK